ncbi:MAG: tRNA lysidine(34) synthetase TilS, partial [Planctomycetota bacterium]
ENYCTETPASSQHAMISPLPGAADRMTNQTPNNAKGRQAGLVDRITDAWPVVQWRDVHVVIAVSGGADSVALLRALSEIKQLCGGAGEVSAAHFNHHTRGADSDADARWVGELCQRLGVRLRSGEAEQKVDGEEAARAARYAFLQQAAREAGARYVVTGHTLDDQVETILFRVFRGTALAGLAGVQEFRELSAGVTLVRPMLQTARAELETYLATLDQPFREDATNTNDRYTRNWIRHTLLPMLRERFGPAVGDAVLGLSEQAAEAQDIIHELAGQQIKAALAGEANERGIGSTLTIDPLALSSTQPIVVREVCKQLWRNAGWPEQPMGRREWRRLQQFVAGPADKSPIMLPGGVRAVWRDGKVVLARRC